MRRHTLALTLSGLTLVAACSRSTSGGGGEPAPRRPPPSIYEPAPPPPHRPEPAIERLEIPRGHLPAIGQCRIWVPGIPPGRQRTVKSISCLVVGMAPPGTWLVYRPRSDRRVIRVRVMDARRRGVITVVRLYHYSDGRWVRDIRPDHEPRDNELDHVRPEGDQPTVMRPFPPGPPPPAPPPAARDTMGPTVMRPFPRQPPPPPAPPAQPDSGRRQPQLPPAPPPAPPPPPANRPPAIDMSPLDIPPGHLPDAGECRVWIPGRVPGQQPRPKSRPCAGIESAAPAGSWILYRPANERVVYVRVLDPRRAAVVILVRVYDLDTNQLVRELAP
ncbi:MAG: hypothetical protein Q8Q14_00300 [Gemmatimonadales bacterium]|nr:hypothetical protein [Gemmatimonadales bacterium]